MLRAAMAETRDDFASLFSTPSAGPSRAGLRLKRGQTVEGTVVHVGTGGVFVDVGGTVDARVDVGEFANVGKKMPAVGERLRATVTGFTNDIPSLSLSLGKGQLDAEALQLAKQAGLPVEGTVTKAVKAGLEVTIGSTRAFCPASQVERTFTAELESYVGQTLQFKVVEIKDGGRSVVLSRRALLEAEREELARARREQLSVGADVEGTVVSVQKYGAFVDLGGIEGMVHISELARGRVERAEDIVKVGDKVTARVLGIEEADKGLRVRLSLKALTQGEEPAQQPIADEVLKGTVTRATSFGVFVQTAKGEGLVPTRELTLPTGSDHRRAFPPGREIEVVVASQEQQGGKLRFSMTGVGRVVERKNFREYNAEGATRDKAGTRGAGSVGSLGQMLRDKLGLPPLPVLHKESASPAAPEAEKPRESARPERAASERPARAEGVVRGRPGK